MRIQRTNVFRPVKDSVNEPTVTWQCFLNHLRQLPELKPDLLVHKQQLAGIVGIRDITRAMSNLSFCMLYSNVLVILILIIKSLFIEGNTIGTMTHLPCGPHKITNIFSVLHDVCKVYKQIKNVQPLAH